MPLLMCSDVSALKSQRSINVHLLVTVRVQAVMSGGNFSLFMLLPLHFPQGVGGVGGKRKCREGLLDNGMVLGVFWERRSGAD